MRIGIGYDIHRLVRGRKLRLGGVLIPHSHGLLGHSDGDALIHAVVDAVLGAAGLGDIGGLFSDKDLRFKNADSRQFLKFAADRLKKKKLQVAFVDAVVIAQKPDLSGHKKNMAAAVAKGLGISAGRVNVKAKTNEGLGAVGQGKAISCYAIVSLRGK